MRKRTPKISCRTAVLASLLAAAFLLPACGSGSSQTLADSVRSEEASSEASAEGTRDSTPVVLTPESPGTTVLGNDTVTIDISNSSEGYISVSATSESRMKLRITPPNDVVYTYDLAGDGSTEYFPLSCGDGTYHIAVYTNVSGKMYATAYETEIDVSLASPYRPFLYPNKEVWFTEDTKAVSVAADVASSADSDLDAISLIYDYVITHVTYDWDEAENVESGYIPDVDEVLETGKGICIDYSALLCAMLRTQRIPTRVEVGYAGTVYHAWVSTYIEDVGWVNGIIRFDGTDWSMMDATLATTESEEDYRDFISDSSNYNAIYLY